MELERWQELVGKRSEPVVNPVEKGAVKKFAEAIADPDPLYTDERVAEESRYGCLIAPPTFPRTFDYGEIEGLRNPGAGLIHGEHRIVYEERPLFVGEEIFCHTLLKDCYGKESRGGRLDFLVLEYAGENPVGNRIFSMEDVAILTPAMRERRELG